jgi:hypothetical protein
MTEKITELDRRSFALDLRKLGLAYTDFEDWDGLSDAEMVGLASCMNNVRIDPELVRTNTHEI